ncbi:MAG TPA: hypothetical protein VFB79_19855 [Candidatus Angelobacter sp.]|nr:hypothetical protein [Candidatus Angelobacter sp.]
MIDKFNFYDIYGYFLPGAAMLLLFWLPWGLVKNSWPASDWGSAVVAIILSYITGHLLQMICTKVIPSSVAKGSDGHARYPSDVVVDRTHTALSGDFKNKLAALVQSKFGLDLKIEVESKATDLVRRDAFFLARHLLIQAKEISYGEQFEGLYTLLRGISVALAFACANYVGWGLSIFPRDWLDYAAVIAIVVGLLTAANLAGQLLRTDLQATTAFRMERMNAVALLLAALGVGYILGRRYEITHTQATELALCALGALIASLRCFGAYKYHCMNFAITVWRDFFASADKPQSHNNAPDV